MIRVMVEAPEADVAQRVADRVAEAVSAAALIRKPEPRRGIRASD